MRSIRGAMFVQSYIVNLHGKNTKLVAHENKTKIATLGPRVWVHCLVQITELCLCVSLQRGWWAKVCLCRGCFCHLHSFPHLNRFCGYHTIKTHNGQNERKEAGANHSHIGHISRQQVKDIRRNYLRYPQCHTDV